MNILLLIHFLILTQKILQLLIHSYQIILLNLYNDLPYEDTFHKIAFLIQIFPHFLHPSNEENNYLLFRHLP